MAGERILVIDDSEQIRTILRDLILGPRGYSVITAPDGKAGLDLALKEAPDLILTDVNMPRMTGIEVLEKLRADAETADTPVIVLTAKSVSAEERQLLTDHIQGLMSKTALTPQSLMAELHRLEALRR